MEDSDAKHIGRRIGTVNIHGSGNTYVGCTVNVNTSGAIKAHDEKENTPSRNIDEESLRQYYIDALCRAPPLPWYPDYTWNIDDIYTDLAIQGSDQRFPLVNLFQHAQEHFRAGSFLRILIEGDAGYGKSTLTLKLASDWAKRNTHDKYNYMKAFDLVLTARLGLMEENDDLLSHLKNIYEDKVNVPLDDILKGRRELQVLIVLDGYDEAKNATKKFVCKIMERSFWSKCHLIVTSRFGHVPMQIRGKNFCLTVKGYGTKQIAMAVGKFFVKSGNITKEDAVRYSFNQTTMEDYDSIEDPIPLRPTKKRRTGEQFEAFMDNVLHQCPYKDLAQCPLLCAMMCCLAGEVPDRRLPETLSGLYFAMINQNLCRTAAKRAIAAGNDPEEWNWAFLKDKFKEEHQEYLKEFGFLCLQGLRKDELLFNLFQLTGNKESGTPSDPEVSRLVEAGVVIKSFGESCNTMYQAPHRTMAEFLASYYLCNETDQSSVELNLLDIFAKATSYEKVFQFIFEMKREQSIVNAFCDIKFPRYFLSKWKFLEKYLTDPKALTENWSNVQKALSPESRIVTLDSCLKVLPQFYKNLQKISFTFKYDILCHPLGQAMDHLLQLVKNQVSVTVGNGYKNKNFFRPRPSVFLDYGQRGDFLENFPPLIDKILSSDIYVASLACVDNTYSFIVGAEIGHRPTSLPVIPTQILQEAMTNSLTLLLKSKNCPAHLAFDILDEDAIVAIINALKDPGNLMCSLKSLEFALSSGIGKSTCEELCGVLAEYWLPERLEHLLLSLKRKAEIGHVINGLRVAENLCSLYLSLVTDMSGQELDCLITGILGSKLESLSLAKMGLTINALSISKYAAVSSCRLKHLSLESVTLTLENRHLFEAKVTPLPLEKLKLDYVTVALELLDWLCGCLSNLKVLVLGYVEKETFFGVKEEFITQLLDILTRANSQSLQTLNFISWVWWNSKQITLQCIRNTLKRCPNIDTILLNIENQILLGSDNESDDDDVSEEDQVQPMDDHGDSDDDESDGDDDNEKDVFSRNDLSASLAGEESVPLRGRDICIALYEDVLDVPKLQTTDFYLNEYPVQKAFYEAIADRAEKWPGRCLENFNRASILTLRGVDSESAACAVTVFRQRKLDFRIQYVGDKIYELWFPPSARSPDDGDMDDIV